MQENIVPQANIALLPPAERAVIVLDSTKAETQLRELVALSSDITAVIDKPGRDQAHRAGMALKTARVAITKIGKEARADARAFADAVVAEEQRLVGIAQPEEDRIFGLRDGYDAKIAAEKAEVERQEAARKARIQGQIAAIRHIPLTLTAASAAEIATEIGALEGFKAGEEFAEFSADADAAALTALATLRPMHARQVSIEEEAARVAAERAELARQRAEADERDRLAAEQRARDEAAAAELRAAQEKELAAQREALEADRREQEAKAAKLEADRAAFARHQEEAKNAQARAALDAVAAAPTPAPVNAKPSDERSGQWNAEEIAAFAASDAAPLEINKIESPAADLPPDEADEAEEIALRGCVECLNIAVRDLLVAGCTADHVRELVEIELKKGAA